MSSNPTPAQSRLLRSTSAELPRPLQRQSSAQHQPAVPQGPQNIKAQTQMTFGQGLPQKMSARANGVMENLGAELNDVEVITAEDALNLLDDVMIYLSNGVGTINVQNAVAKLNLALKAHGPVMEIVYKDQMSKLSATFSQACKDERLDMVSRLYLLEIIEIRAMDWKTNEHLECYYKQKLLQLGHKIQESNPSANNSSSPLKRSVSLNVNAPEYTPSPPHAKPAKPALEVGHLATRRMDTGDCGGGGRFICKVNAGGNIIELAGKNIDLLQTAKSVLETHFAALGSGTTPSCISAAAATAAARSARILRPPQESSGRIAPADPSPGLVANGKDRRDENRGEKAADQKSNEVIRYDRDELLRLAESNPGLAPPDWPAVVLEFPDLKRGPCHVPHPLPYDWKAAFVDAGFAVSAAPSIPAVNSSTVNNVNKTGEAPRKKNFLEVLRPNAPVRAWDEELGEWVERGELQTRG